MKKLFCLLGGLFVLGISLLESGEMSGVGNEELLRNSASLTNIYVGTKGSDLQNYNAATLRLFISSGGGAAVFSIKPQWTDDISRSPTNWIDESVLVAGTAANGEQVYTNLSRVIQFQSTSNLTYIERYNRLSRYFRVAAKSDTASPTWSSLKGIEISVTPVNQ